MFGLRRFGIKLGLDTIKNILERLDNPQKDYHCIHIAGTNGKGSVASMLASILKVGGYRTGLYTSPHLVHFNERIRVNDRPISDKDVVESYRSIITDHDGEREPTFFECTTAMALAEFARQKVDWAVVETGMGGRLDATNVIEPALSIITNISLEHREYLGNTVSRIASEKAGIIKPSAAVLTGVRQSAAIRVIEHAAQRNKVPLYRLGRDFKTRKTRNNTFTYYGLDHVWPAMKTSLLGEHQRENTALVLAACELLNRKYMNLGPEQIASGLKNTYWPGRLEIVSKDPTILLDGAHNLMAARNLARFLATNVSPRKIILVVGILDDKPYRQMLRALVPVCSSVIVTRPTIGRALDPQVLLPVINEMGKKAVVIGNVPDALRHAIRNSKPDQTICVAGSLYVVGEAQQEIEKQGLQFPVGS